MNYEKEREEFFQVMLGEGVPRDVTRLILRDAATLARIAIMRCNYEMTEREEAKMEKKDTEAENRITRRLEPFGIVPHFSGDPRGYVVKLMLKSGRYNTWGGRESGFGVPTRV